MERPSTAPRWKMQIRILLSRCEPRSAAKAVWRRKFGPHIGPAPRQTKARAPCLRKIRRFTFMLFPLEFRRADDEGDELRWVDSLRFACFTGGHNILLEDFPGGVAD